jgi:FAD/FMN-containing dehydrogenase
MRNPSKTCFMLCEAVAEVSNCTHKEVKKAKNKPGTFGVVVEATMRAFPSPKLTVTRWWLKTTNPNDTTSIYAPAAYTLSAMPELNQLNGVQGYFYIYPNEIYVKRISSDTICKTKTNTACRYRC